MKKAFLLVSLCAAVFTPVSAQEILKSDRIANPGKTSYKDTILDFCYGLEVLGYDAASPEIEQLVRRVQKDMGMQDWYIPVRKMSQTAIGMMGRENAFVMGLFVNRMYISEDWFNELSEDERVAIIRHEFTHLKKQHAFKKYGAGIVLGYLAGYCIRKATGAALGYIDNNDTMDADEKDNAKWESKELIEWAVNLVFMRLGVSYFSRVCEREADEVSAQDPQAARGGVKVWQGMIDKRDPYSRFFITRAIEKVGQTLGFWRKWFSTHPADEERRDFFKQQVEKHEKAGNLVAAA